ncbi:MAG: GTPase Era [Gammaproteobacteria bacterium]|nr:GTPase Era [Gammaproteobacteria bacterium]
MTDNFRSGLVTLIGRPNTGKSTLLNVIIGQPISIASPKPQTTRHRLLGIHTTEHAQLVFVDTPGFHIGEKKAINHYMNKAALSSLHDVDAVVWLIQAGRWTEEEDALLTHIKAINCPVIAAVNKIDLLNDKLELLPFIEKLNAFYSFVAIVPLSAKKGDGVEQLVAAITQQLAIGELLYDADQITDKSMRFLAAERVREQIFHRMQEELPYSIAVEIEQFVEDGALYRIAAVIWVEKDSHKGMVIGKQGQQLKDIGRAARLAMEKLFERKVFLELWVRVKEGWSDDVRALRSLGYDDNELK